jgi:predicted DsbA family dithiol-disulfide isomerase
MVDREMSQKVTIDLFSDVMCPWCIIGYKQLEKGLAQLEGEIEAEVRWRPFELNPDMPPEGEGQAEHIARKYGRDSSEIEANRGRMREFGDRAGYDFRYRGEGDGPRPKMWNTLLAHKLLAWTLDAAGAEAQTRLKRALFDAHFQQRQTISDPEVLLDIARSLGLDRAAAEAALADEALTRRVRQEQEAAWDMNISGVPAMLIQGKFLIPGAQEPEVYVNALRRVVAREAQAQAG